MQRMILCRKAAEATGARTCKFMIGMTAAAGLQGDRASLHAAFARRLA